MLDHVKQFYEIFGVDISKMNLGTKHDQDKPPMDLVPDTRGVAQAFAYGAKEYGRYNWCKGLTFGQTFAAAKRHMDAFWFDLEELDQKSGVHHIDCASAELLMLRTLIRHRPDLDDRFKEWVDVGA